MYSFCTGRLIVELGGAIERFRYDSNLYYRSEDVDGRATSSIQQWAQRTDVESDRQDRLSLPKDKDAGIGTIFIAKKLCNRQEAEELVEVIRNVATGGHDHLE